MSVGQAGTRTVKLMLLCIRVPGCYKSVNHLFDDVKNRQSNLTPLLGGNFAEIKEWNLWQEISPYRDSTAIFEPLAIRQFVANKEGRLREIY